MQVPRLRARGQGRVQGRGHGRGVHSQGYTAPHMYMNSFPMGRRYKGFIPRSENPRAKRDVV